MRLDFYHAVATKSGRTLRPAHIQIPFVEVPFGVLQQHLGLIVPPSLIDPFEFLQEFFNFFEDWC